METWNSLVDKLDRLLTRIKLESTVKIAGREIRPVIAGFGLILVCIPVWGYLEFEGKNKAIGALVVVLMAWGVAQLGALGLGDGVGKKPGSPPTNTDNASTIDHPVDGAETQPHQRQKLSQLAFAGVVAALAVIYLVRNFDRYEDLSGEFRYRELVDQVEPIEDAIEVALLARVGVQMDLLDSGEAGLPDEVLVSDEGHGISVIDGRVFATWIKDESDLDGVTYIRTPKIEGGKVEWATTGTCSAKKVC